MRWLTRGLLLVAVVLIATSAKVRAEISETDIDKIANDVLDEPEKPIKALELLKVTDPLNVQDDPEPKVDHNGVSARLGWGTVGSALFKLTNALSKAVSTKLKSFFRGIRKVSKFVINKVSSTTKKVWEKIKSKFPGNFKNKMRKAGKKLVKKVLREVFEEAAELTLEYIQAMVVEYIRTKSEEELCECPIENDTVKCRCCIKPPGFEKACMVVRARPQLQWFAFSFRYNGTEFMKAKIAEDERGPCQKDIVDLSRKVCRNLPHYLHFLSLCFIPGSMYATEDEGFVGCFQMHVDSLKLGLERCVMYTPSTNPKEKGIVNLLTPEELGLEE